MPDTLTLIVVGFILFMVFKGSIGRQAGEAPIIQITPVPHNQSSGGLPLIIMGIVLLAVLITLMVHP